MTITIHMSDRAPVEIDTDTWPLIVSVSGTSADDMEYCRREQAIGQGECDTYKLRVRQHADGRSIVYAIYEGATQWTGHPVWHAGRVIDGADDIAAVIRDVATECEPPIPESVIREAIADLPAERL